MENKVGSGESGRRRFIRRLTTLGAAGGIATLLYGRVTEKPLIQLAQAASGDYLFRDFVNTAADTTELDSTLATSSSGASAFKVVTSATSGYKQGVYGESKSPTGIGVYGAATATSGLTAGMEEIGILGRAYGDAGAGETGPWPCGVEGYASGTSGATTGVWGHVVSPDGIAVEGNDGFIGVYGHTSFLGAYGVIGRNYATTGHAPGVHGRTESADGYGVEGYASHSNGPSRGVYGHAESPNGTGVYGEIRANGGVGILGHAHDSAPGGVPIVALAASGQTASLQEWQNSSGNALSVVDAAGQLGIGIASPARQLHIRGNNAVARLDRNVDSASFIFVRTNTDYSQVLKTFTFGVKATGVDSGSFFIGDMHTNVSGSSDNRLLIDTSGNVGIGTTTPSSKLHVNGRVKALGYDTGDIKFANSFTVTENEKAGLAFKNDSGEKIAVLDRQGNFHIKGDIIKDL